MAIDTLQLSKELQDVEFTPGQADALARIFLEHTNGKLRGDIEKLEQGLTERFQADIERLEQRLTKHLQTSLREFQETMQREIAQLWVELLAEIKAGDASAKVDLTKWIVGAIILNLMGTAGLMITLIRTIPH